MSNHANNILEVLVEILIRELNEAIIHISNNPNSSGQKDLFITATTTAITPLLETFQLFTQEGIHLSEARKTDLVTLLKKIEAVSTNHQHSYKLLTLLEC